MRSYLGAALINISVVLPAAAWGPEGHSIVAEGGGASPPDIEDQCVPGVNFKLGRRLSRAAYQYRALALR